MNSIEVTVALNNPTDRLVKTVEESKARFWIRKGVDRACEKAIAQIQESIEEIEARPGWTAGEKAAVDDLEVDIRVLQRVHIREALTASAWHRRGK